MPKITRLDCNRTAEDIEKIRFPLFLYMAYIFEDQFKSIFLCAQQSRYLYHSTAHSSR